MVLTGTMTTAKQTLSVTTGAYNTMQNEYQFVSKQ
jgi:hypothetical protein